MGKLNDWLALVANVSVVAGIVFLAFEISQNTEAIRINTAQAMATEQADFNRQFMNPDVAEILVRVGSEGHEALSEIQKIQLNGFDNSWLFVQQNNYYQYLVGSLDPGIWAGRHRAIVDTFASAANMRAHWESRGFAFSDEFRRYIDQEVLPEARAIARN